jgi:hypothetical protein
VHYHQEYRHTQYLTNKEDIEFRKVLYAKQMSEKSLKAKHIRKLEILPQSHLGSNLDEECFILFYNPCATILLTYTS